MDDYSVDLRERVVRAVEAGLSRRAAARRFEVSVSFVVKLDTSKNLGEAGLICSTVGCSGGGSAWGVGLGFSTSESGWRGCR